MSSIKDSLGPGREWPLGWATVNCHRHQTDGQWKETLCESRESLNGQFRGMTTKSDPLTVLNTVEDLCIRFREIFQGDVHLLAEHDVMRLHLQQTGWTVHRG